MRTLRLLPVSLRSQTCQLARGPHLTTGSALATGHEGQVWQLVTWEDATGPGRGEMAWLSLTQRGHYGGPQLQPWRTRKKPADSDSTGAREQESPELWPRVNVPVSEPMGCHLPGLLRRQLKECPQGWWVDGRQDGCWEAGPLAPGGRPGSHGNTTVPIPAAGRAPGP